VFVAGIDGCRGGWIAFKVDLTSLGTLVDALRWHRNEAECVCTPERDEKDLSVAIRY
jgi:hypothetical protein